MFFLGCPWFSECKTLNHYSIGVFPLRNGQNPCRITVCFFVLNFLPSFFRCSYDLHIYVYIGFSICVLLIFLSKSFLFFFGIRGVPGESRSFQISIGIFRLTGLSASSGFPRFRLRKQLNHYSIGVFPLRDGPKPCRITV